MYASEFTCISLWWLFPIVMMILCFFMMRNRRGMGMCCFGPRNIANDQTAESDSVIEILDKRYASGEIDNEEYQDKKQKLTDSTDSTNA